MREAWPGPLTLVLPASGKLPEELTRDGRAALRCPGSLLLRELALSLSAPILSTSANRAGGKAPARLAEIEPELLKACDLAVDAGTLCGQGSTIARPEAGGSLTILRPGLWKPPV